MLLDVTNCTPINKHDRSLTGAGEAVLATIRRDVFDSILGRRCEFFDRHSAAELASLVSSQLNVLREVGLASLSRDRCACCSYSLLRAPAAVAATAYHETLRSPCAASLAGVPVPSSSPSGRWPSSSC